METVGCGDTEGAHDPRAASSGATSDRCYDEVLKVLVGLSARTSPSETLVSDALEAVVAALGLGGATFSLVREKDGALHLEPAASVGSHAAFARDMSARPLASLADAATAVADGQTVFVAEETVSAGLTPQASGVGRWRSGISVLATAILPVRAWGEVLGVLTIEWPCADPVDDADREALEAIANVIGLLHHAAQRQPGSDPEESAAGLGTGATRAVLCVTRQGVVVTLGAARHARSEVALVLSVVARADGGGAAPFWDAVGADAGRAVVAVGLASAHPGAAHSLADTCSNALRTLFVQGAPVDAALDYLAATVRATARPGGSVSAATCALDFGDTSVGTTCCAGGNVAFVAVSREGRVWTVGVGGEALGGSIASGPREVHHALLVEGDRLVCVAGLAVAPEGLDLGAAVAEALGRPVDDGELAERALDLIGGPSSAGAVMVARVGGPDPA